MEGTFFNISSKNVSSLEMTDSVEQVGTITNSTEEAGLDSFANVRTIAYYLEGVILTPVSIVGLFGKRCP